MMDKKKKEALQAYITKLKEDDEYKLFLAEMVGCETAEALKELDVPFRDICSRMIYARDIFQNIGYFIFDRISEAALDPETEVELNVGAQARLIAYILYDDVHLVKLDKPLDKSEMDKFSKIAKGIITRIIEEIAAELEEAAKGF